MLFAIDHGNYQMKTTRDCFISGLSEHAVQPPLAADIIEWKGKYWTLTENRLPYIRNKMNDDCYFILSLFAIARDLKNQGSLPCEIDADLAVGLPPEHFSALQEQFAEYLKREAVKFNYNGESTCLNIRRVFVYPQAYAAVVPRRHMLAGTPRLFIIDIGGMTTDVLLLRYGKPDLQFCRSIETGVITMNNNIIGRVSSQHDILIEDDHIAAAIQGRETILPESVIQTIWDSTKRHTDSILNKLRELQVDLRSTPAIFIGGGANLFRQYIEESQMVAKADFITDPKSNAAGYMILATAHLQKLHINGGGNGNA